MAGLHIWSTSCECFQHSAWFEVLQKIYTGAVFGSIYHMQYNSFLDEINDSGRSITMGHLVINANCDFETLCLSANIVHVSHFSNNSSFAFLDFWYSLLFGGTI